MSGFSNDNFGKLAAQRVAEISAAQKQIFTKEWRPSEIELVK